MSRVWTPWTLGSKGQRSRSQCKDYWKWFFAHNCFPFTPIFMKLHMQSPHESSMCAMKFRVQRSRSQCKDYWKWFLAHNCFPFTPIFMKLHMQSPLESSMDPMDFGVKRSKVKVVVAWFNNLETWFGPGQFSLYSMSDADFHMVCL